jgi:hypothetical protein
MLQRVSGDVGDGVSRVLTAVGSPLPKPPAVTHGDLAAPQRTVGRELATTRDQADRQAPRPQHGAVPGSAARSRRDH